MEKKELLKTLGFDEKFISIIESETFEIPTFSYISEDTSEVGFIDINPKDTKEVIIEKTNSPQSVIFNVK